MPTKIPTKGFLPSCCIFNTVARLSAQMVPTLCTVCRVYGANSAHRFNVKGGRCAGQRYQRFAVKRPTTHGSRQPVPRCHRGCCNAPTAPRTRPVLSACRPSREGQTGAGGKKSRRWPFENDVSRSYFTLSRIARGSCCARYALARGYGFWP